MVGRSPVATLFAVAVACQLATPSTAFAQPSVSVAQARTSASGSVVKPSWQVKKNVVAHIPDMGGLDPRDWFVRLARSDRRYAAVSSKTSNSGYAFLRREPNGRWLLLEDISWGSAGEDLCTVAKLKRASVPKPVRRDFVAAQICYR